MKNMAQKISFKKANTLSKLPLDYLYHTEKLKSFISGNPTMDSFEERITKRQNVNRNLLVEVLKEQNVDSNHKSIKNIDLLTDNNTFTITTGHQICSFTGPLYSVYKIISTINLAKQLKTKYPSKNFVPVFWMATEDHDFEEINHINLFNQKITWNTNQKGPVGRFNLDDISTFLSEIKEKLGTPGKDISTLISFYENSTNLAEATHKMIDFLFGEFGLVILDADSKKLKQEMVSIFENELVNQQTFEKINETSSELKSLGYKTQVTPRKINLFYQKNELRERITEENKGYKILNTNLVFSKEEILEELKNFPERFSPNVVLRPIYQEKILPNLAYIGGPGETAYWFQLKKAFDFHGIDFPILVLRNSVLLLKQNVLKKIKKLPFSVEEYFKKEDELIKQFINEVSDISFEGEIAEIEKIFELTKEKAIRIDFSLERTVIGELKKAQKSINLIQSKVIKAEKRKNENSINQIKSIKKTLFPNNSFQERVNNIIEFYSPELIKNLADNLISLEDNITLIEI